MVPGSIDPIETALCELVAEVAHKHGTVQLKALGASMLPSVWPGDHLIVRSQDPTEIQPGRIILYKRNGGLVAHRMVSRRGNEWVTRGDCMRYADPPVRLEEIVGEIVAVVRGGRRVAPEWTPVRRAAAWILRRSDFSVRVLLHLRRKNWTK